MQLETLKALIEQAIPQAVVEVKGDGYHHEATVVSQEFETMSLIQRQRRVYEAVTSFIESGELHALSIKAKTPAEWEALRNHHV